MLTDPAAGLCVFPPWLVGRRTFSYLGPSRTYDSCFDTRDFEGGVLNFPCIFYSCQKGSADDLCRFRLRQVDGLGKPRVLVLNYIVIYITIYIHGIE